MPSSISLVLVLVLLHISLSGAADPPPSAPVSTSTVCNSTLYPTYCKGVLQSDNHTSASVYEYGYFSFKRSLSQANKFLTLVDRYLSKSRKLALTPSAVRALQDCQLLAQLNIDYLTETFQTLSSANKTLTFAKADDVQTFLSGIITNQQTCLDGLQSTASAWSLRSGLSSPLSNDTKLYSVSLALITKGWVPKNKKGPFKRGSKQSGFKHGRLPLVMSDSTRQIFESASRRKLADDDEEVMISDIVTVSQDGTGNFTTIMEAVAIAPNNTDGSNGYFLIYVTAGEYSEYVTVDKKKKYIMMIGDGINQTVITGNRSVVDGWTTFNSATLAVVGTGFVGVNITVRNTAGPAKHQAVALRNGADLSTFYSCSFEAYQDTLYAHSLRQFYRECDVYGTVDFIFGNSAVVFQDCNLYPRLPLAGQFNAITAQGRTDPNQNTGTSLHNCTVRPADDLAAANSTTQTYLGRPWKQYSRTVYLQSYIDGFVNPVGWMQWNGTFALDTLYYGEFNNTGPGSGTANRVTWPGYHVMNSTDAGNFTASSFLLVDDWLPSTGVPYFTGLL